MTDQTDKAHLLELTTELTAAWLSNPKNKLAADQLPKVIESIYGALSGASQAKVEEEAEQFIPAVTVRHSLASRDHIISMIDGKPYKMLKRHLSRHGLTPNQYRARYGLKPDYPMVARTYAEHRQALAKQIGLGRKSRGVAPEPTEAAPAAPTPKRNTKPRKATAESSRVQPDTPTPAKRGRPRKAVAQPKSGENQSKSGEAES